MSDLGPDVVVVGAGQAGLGSAALLMDAGLDVVVLERGRVGETWRSQRWKTFRLNTPNWMNGLPGVPYAGADPHGFMDHHELVSSFDTYAANLGIDVRTGLDVTSVAPGGSRGRFVVRAVGDDGEQKFTCNHVVVASGIASRPRIPPMASRLPGRVLQLGTGTYRSAEKIPDGAILVVGGAQSGAQIVEDLAASGRTVYYSISRVGRFPRRYRGRDFMEWFSDMGVWDMRTTDVADPAVLTTPNPLTSGVGAHGHTISYQQLAGDGVRLLGRLQGVDDKQVRTDDLVADYIRHGDETSLEIKGQIDSFIAESGMDASEPDDDPADIPWAGGASPQYASDLDIDAADISTVIWATGFTGDFSWIDFPCTDDNGKPVHIDGVSSIPGLYFIGLPWLSSRKSGVLYGIEDDATHITEQIVSDETRRPPS